MGTTERFTFTFHFHALEKELATYPSVLARRIPGTEEPSALLSMGSHRVGHNWSDLAARRYMDFPRVSAGEESAWNAAELDLIPGLGRFPGERKGYPLQYSGLENSMGHKEVDTSKQLSLFREVIYISLKVSLTKFCQIISSLFSLLLRYYILSIVFS